MFRFWAQQVTSEAHLTLQENLRKKRDQGLGQVSTRVCLQVNMLALGFEHLSGRAVNGSQPPRHGSVFEEWTHLVLSSQDEDQTLYVMNPSGASWSHTRSLPVLVAQRIVEGLLWLLLKFRYFS